MWTIAVDWDVKQQNKQKTSRIHKAWKAGPVAQSVESLIADPCVLSLSLALSRTFLEIDYEILSMVILLLLLIQKGLLSVTGKSICTEY